MTKEIHISILDADHMNLHTELAELKAMDIKYIHLDIGDTSFIPTVTFGAKIMSQILSDDYFTFDVHFMMSKPLLIIDKMDLSKVACITIHYEIDDFDMCLANLVDYKNVYGFEIGVAIKPGTYGVPDSVLARADRILIMTVEPGFGGQKFIDKCVGKIGDIRSRFVGKVGVDGGVNIATIELAKDADYFIVGSYFFKHNDKRKCLLDLQDIIS